MHVSRIFIERPVMTGLVTFAILLFGVVGFRALPVAALPSVDYPTIQVMAALPGAQAVGATDDQELADNNHSGNVTVEGYTPPPDDDYGVEVPAISSGFFHAMQIPILAGRSFTEDDDMNHPLVAIVNETFAKHFFKSTADAVGKRVAHGGGNHLTFMTIVGVVREGQRVIVRQVLNLPVGNIWLNATVVR